MGIGLVLEANVGDGDNLLDRVVASIRVHAGDALESADDEKADDGAPRKVLLLHPAAQSLSFTLREGTLVAAVETTPVGPGFHVFVCELLDECARDIGFAWAQADESRRIGDETEFFHRRDHALLERHFLCWLSTLAGVVSKKHHERGTAYNISMATTHAYRAPGAAHTPLGPRDVEWLDRVIVRPSEGLDFFPWWESGRGAHYELGRALARMWVDVRWRVPSFEDETLLLEDMADVLARAHALDPSLSFPWREWEDILDWIDADDPLRPVVKENACRATGPLVGYRRYPVRVSLGGWSIEIPGEFAETWTQEGRFCAWADGRAIWFTPMRLNDVANDCVELPRRLPDGDPIAIAARPPLEACAGWGWLEEGAETYRRLVAFVGAPGGAIALVSLMLPKDEDARWAVSVVESIEREHPGLTPREHPGLTPREHSGLTPREHPGLTPHE